MADVVLTTTEVANICDVSVRMVIKWIDENYLVGYNLPNSKYRRVKYGELEKFMTKYKLPKDKLYQYKDIILIVDQNPSNYAINRDKYNVGLAANAFEFGFKINKYKPFKILIDSSICTALDPKILNKAKSKHNPEIILIDDKMTSKQLDAVLLKYKLDGHLHKPVIIN